MTADSRRSGSRAATRLGTRAGAVPRSLLVLVALLSSVAAATRRERERVSRVTLAHAARAQLTAGRLRVHLLSQRPLHAGHGLLMAYPPHSLQSSVTWSSCQLTPHLQQRNREKAADVSGLSLTVALHSQGFHDARRDRESREREGERQRVSVSGWEERSVGDGE